MYDFSHILDFCSQLRALNIEGSYEKLGTSSIVPNELHFDLVSFKNLVDLKILGVPMACIQSVGEYARYSFKIFGLLLRVVEVAYYNIVIIVGLCNLFLPCTLHH